MSECVPDAKIGNLTWKSKFDRALRLRLCHSIDGSASIGPTWHGLYGKEETLVDGSKVLVDDAYLRDSRRSTEPAYL